MNAFIATILALVFLPKQDEASAKTIHSLSGQVIRDETSFFSNDRLMHHEVHRIISSFHAQTRHSIHPKYGSGMEDLLSNSDPSETIHVDVVFSTPLTLDQAASILESAVDEIQVLACFHSSCSIYVSMDQLEEIAKVDAVLFIEHMKPMSHVEETTLRHRNLIGSVTSDGDVALFADKARAKYSVNGAGILVGIIGDTFDCFGGYANDTETGDLPTNITVLTYFNTTACKALEYTLPIDQSRALMQVIYDVAPGAQFAFKGIANTQVATAAAIQELAQIGCDIIVSAFNFASEPFFQDGILAQAVDRVASQGVAFFSGAGENARSAWDAPSGFVPVTVNDTLFVINETEATARYHQFGDNATEAIIQYHQFGQDANGKPIISQRIAVQNIFTPVSITMQWDEPSLSASGAPGCQVDLDLYLLRNNTVVAKSVVSNIGRNPLENIWFEPWLYSNTTGEYVTVDMVIVKKQGNSPKNLKVIPFAPVVDVKFEFATNTPTIVGMKNAKSSATVGVAPFFMTPAFGVSPPVLQFFSGVGGVPILFDQFGNRTDAPEIRKKPNVVGPDSVRTTFYSNGPQGLYYGTPCAAGHVAGVAALLLELAGGPKSLKPLDLYGILERTAIDMNDNATAALDTGFDFSSGYGLVNASAALDVADSFTAAPTPAPVPSPHQNAPGGSPSGSLPLPFYWTVSILTISWWFLLTSG